MTKDRVYTVQLHVNKEDFWGSSCFRIKAEDEEEAIKVARKRVSHNYKNARAYILEVEDARKVGAGFNS